MTLSVTVLGCAGTYAGAGNACSGFLVRSETTALWVDAGPGTLANLQGHMPLRSLEAVFVSHSHPDHWLELPVLKNALRYGVSHEGVRVLGTAETRDLNHVVCGGEVEPTFLWEVIEDEGTATVGDLQLTFSRTDHYVETLALRVDSPDGRSLAYSADTGPGWSFTEFGDDIDLAICEASFLAHREPEGILHLSARQAGAMAAGAHVDRLLLTHILPGCASECYAAEATEAFGRPVEMAVVGETYEV